MDVLNRTTKAYRRSVNTPDFPTVDWIHSPDMSAVTGWDSKYWIITGDIVTLMDLAARDAVDAAEDADELADNRTGAEEAVDDSASEGMAMRAQIETYNKRDNYLINRILELQAHVISLQDAIANSTGGVANTRTDVGALDLSTSATATRTRAETVTAYTAEITSGGVDI